MASGEVSKTTTYLCTGSPLPTDIEAIAKALFNEDFVDVFERIGAMQVAKGLALVDIVQQLLPCAPLLMHLTPYESELPSCRVGAVMVCACDSMQHAHTCS